MKKDIKTKTKKNVIAKIDILGVEYTIYLDDCKTFHEENRIVYGVCDYNFNVIYLNPKFFNDLSVNGKKFYNVTMRHEILHAYLYESGLAECSNTCDSWALNEEMVDWFATQSKKIFETYAKLNILDA